MTPSDLVKYAIFPHQFLKIPTEGLKFTLFATVMFENIWRFFNQTIFPEHIPNPTNDAEKNKKAYLDHSI